MDKCIDVEPLVAMLHHHGWPLAVEDPDPAKDGFESNAMRIYGPQFDRRFGSGLLLYWLLRISVRKIGSLKEQQLVLRWKMS